MHVHYIHDVYMMCHCCDSVQTLRAMWTLQLASRTPLSPDLQCLRTHLPLTPLTRSYQPLVEEEEKEEYLRSDTLTCVSMTEYSTQCHALIVQAVMNNIVHVLLVQALRNVVNRSGKIAQNIFDQLDRRLKSADKKEQSGVRGQGVGGQGVGGQGREGAQKKKMSKKGPSDNPTHTQVSV